MAEHRKKSIDDFIAQISEVGLASPNRYWVEFLLPRGVSGSGGEVREESTSGKIKSVETSSIQNGKLSIMCNAAQMPGRSFMTVEHRHYQTPIKIPYATQYDDVSFTFTTSQDFRERKFFEIWQETIVNIKTGTMNFYDEYVSDIKVHQLDREGQISYSILIKDAYPINIGAVDYSYSTQNDIQNSTVSFSYKYWEAIPVDYDKYKYPVGIAPNQSKLEDIIDGFVDYATDLFTF